VQDVVWSAGSSIITVTFLSPLPKPAPPLVATLDLGHAYPIPPPANRSSISNTSIDALTPQLLWTNAPAMRLLRLDGIPFHVLQARAAIDTLVSSLPPEFTLSDRIATLGAAVKHYATRCANDCWGRGVCDHVSSYPPACICAVSPTNASAAGASGSDCSAATCPSDCSGRGACDSVPVCTSVEETGEVTCVGGSGICACNGPAADGRQWTGPSCSLIACPSAFVVLQYLATAGLSADSIRAKYVAQGLRVDAVWVKDWDGVARAPGAVAGDQYNSPGEYTGIALVRFLTAADAGVARYAEEILHPSVPSRGVAVNASVFLTQYANAQTEQRLVENIFVNAGLVDAASLTPCSGRGTCAGTTGRCTCASTATATYSGDACELTTCPAGCGGHGSCNTFSGVCACDKFYVADVVAGCTLAPLGLASTTCEDDFRNTEVNGDGDRVAPMQLACALGVPLGQATASGYCPATVVNPATAAQIAAALAGTLARDPSDCYLLVHQGTPCAACSGYDVLNASAIATPGLDNGMPHMGVGALVPSALAFGLDAFRARGVAFSTFLASPAIVRRWSSCDCLAANAYCGANFTVMLDGVAVWNQVVQSSTTLRIDVRGVSELLLTTTDVQPDDWRPGDAPYSGGPAPGVARAPQRAVFCNGAAWADARLV
jgi:hypothetical protein